MIKNFVKQQQIYILAIPLVPLYTDTAMQRPILRHKTRFYFTSYASVAAFKTPRSMQARQKHARNKKICILNELALIQFVKTSVSWYTVSNINPFIKLLSLVKHDEYKMEMHL